MTAFDFLNYFGVFVFAISGALAGMRQGMDVFGITVVALMPAVGGGTLRDVMLDVPVFWVQDPTWIWVPLMAVILSYAIASKMVGVRLKALIWADAIGLSVFAILGTQKALMLGHDPTVAIIMGVVTGVAGGIMRDIICNEENLVLRKEIYATAAFVGAGLYCVMHHFGVDPAINLWTSVAVTLAVRLAGVLFGLSLPRSRPAGDKPS